MSATPRPPYDGPAVVVIGTEEIPVHARLRVTMCTRLGEEWAGVVSPDRGTDHFWQLWDGVEPATLRTEHGESAFRLEEGTRVDKDDPSIAIDGQGRPPF
ncbi:DUF4873 domain-containing protein [Actinacidiphila acidipaludis]|uniref:DUF4873 domain-containing protein n=1 Tax=Actinacidiphila acidipaludis TaxID=2873382 RepID=A0ABS7Q9V2_9ACTN|nr:DUF4873 domain-containing protein [Streptomyces acidipaludis]MBY8879952.1 DUF4873 domain-containing protein [Streptomyces acidipaludis]